MLIQWRSDLECGVSQIDNQHREIFNRVNALLEASQQGKGRAEIGRVMEFLATYVVAHFASEEQLMLKTGYSGYADHSRLHHEFVADFAQLKFQFDSEGATPLLVIQVQRRVVDWLLSHIGREDKQVAAHVKVAAAAR